MLSTQNKINHLDRWLYLFISVHVIAWTLAPYLMRYTLPMDAMEGTIWAQHLQWGYDKNPFVNGWLTSLALNFSEQAEWGIYLFSQLSVAVCFWSVWELAKKILPPTSALMAVLILEGAQYYNFHAIDFDDNTVELSLWALTSLFLYNAVQKQQWRDWLLTGVFAALGMMTKYYTIMLCVPIGFFLVVNAYARRSFSNPAFYAGVALFLSVVTPHVVWLFNHDFVTVRYALERVTSNSILPHVNYPAVFAWEQFAVFLPSLVLTALLMTGRRPMLASHRIAMTSFNRQFLFFLGVAPYLLTVILAALMGMKLRAGWGEPLLSLWGIILMASLQPDITPAKFYRFMIIFFSLLATAIACYVIQVARTSLAISANYPGAIIAATLTRTWHETQHTPLRYVAGSRWLAGNIAFYSKDKPTVYIDCNKQHSPWVDEADLQKFGGMFVWNMARSDEPPPELIRQRFKNLGSVQIMHYSWLRHHHLQPVSIGVAYLAPNA